MFGKVADGRASAMNIGRHAVERGAALGLHRAQYRQRIEALAREDHRGAVRHAAQVADAPCRNSDRAARGCRRGRLRVSFTASPTKKALFRMLWCVSGGALRCAGRAGRELDVDRHRRTAAGAARSARRARSAASAGRRQLVEVPHARRSVCAEPDHRAQRRQRGAPPFVRRGVLHFRREAVQNRDVVGLPEARRQDECLAFDLVQCVRELVAQIRGVDVDAAPGPPWRMRTAPAPTRRSSATRCRAGRPARALDPSGRGQARRRWRFNSCIGPANLLMWHNQRLALGMRCGHSCRTSRRSSRRSAADSDAPCT